MIEPIYTSDNQVLYDGRTVAEHRADHDARKVAWARDQARDVDRDDPDVPLKEAGCTYSYPARDQLSQLLQNKAREEQIASQKVMIAVAPGATVTLRDGRTLMPGEELTLADLEGNVAALVILRKREVITQVTPDVAWQRCLPSNVGPFVWYGDREKKALDGTIVRKGDTVTPDMFRPAPPPPDDVTIAIRKLNNVPFFPETRTSEFANLKHAGKILRNPNYRATPKGAKKETKK